jgi:hypothetical protein
VCTVADIIELRDRLSRIFATAFRVEDIAESLMSCDVGQPSSEVLAVLQRRRFRFVGLRELGVVTVLGKVGAWSPGPTCRSRRHGCGCSAS